MGESLIPKKRRSEIRNLCGREPDVSPFVGGSESRLRAKWCDGRRSGQFLVFVFLFLQPLLFFFYLLIFFPREVWGLFPEE